MSSQRVTRIWLGLVAALVLAGAVSSAALAAPPTDPQRHHIGFGIGFAKLLSDDLKDETLDIDFTNAANGFFEYRLSLTPMVDLAITSRGTASMDEALGVDATLANSFFGPGVRINGSGAIRPYAQANLFFVSETVELEQGNVTVSDDWTGFGFGVSGGIDVKLSKLLSLPVEANYMFAEPEDDVSGVGFSIGLMFNWGTLQ